MIVQFAMFNIILINELIIKYNYLHIVLACIINYISLFNHLFGGTGGFINLIVFSALCTIAFAVTMKLLKNLEQNLIVNIGQK
jgi:hypothetical protein